MYSFKTAGAFISRMTPGSHADRADVWREGIHDPAPVIVCHILTFMITGLSPDDGLQGRFRFNS